MKKGLLVFLTVLLVASMALGSALVLGAVPTPSPLGGGEGNHQSSLSPQVWENSAKLAKVSERLALADLAALGIPLSGVYVDAPTATFYVGLTEIKYEYTAPIKAIVSEVRGVNLVFFKARFTEAELRSLQRKIEAVFLGVTSADMEKLYAIEDKAIRDKMRKEFMARTKSRLAEGIPLTLIGVNIKDNGLAVGLKEIRPQYIEAIIKVVGTEVPIEFIEGELLEDSTRTDRHRPLLGGIQLVSWDSSDGRYYKNTLGFRATRTDGTIGFVMTGHNGWAGDGVWQPTRVWWWPWGDRVGTISVNPPGQRYSDAAFVPTTDINPILWPNRSIVDWRSSFLTPPGTQVRMEGIASGSTVGVVHRTNVTVPSATFGILHNQVQATYARAQGDSGAPVFETDGAGNAILFGIHQGTHEGFAVYSPVEGVQRDLGLHWGGAHGGSR